ncbi:glycosyltransferase family 22 protein [Pluteus cervinus]|uniref:Glycosyltransferase family 22 protein n=1 Tax=Pluteus cervinus TaxID=181527 RepID=A0ACD3BI87_9AGAR|nr:glycosyltransferase family 22 protein [Pluteus cervinus]
MSGPPQTLRLRRPEAQEKAKPTPRHTGILQDQLRRAARRPWSPSFSLAVRILLLVRITGAMYSNISDCDEVFNFWEPLHYLDRGHGFQTWETSPAYALRSWAYIYLHLLPSKLATILLGQEKRPLFFAVRSSLALISVLVEARFYRTVFEKVNERVGRYLFFMLLFSAGMWNASTAFLPSSFAMYCTTLAYSYAITPSSSSDTRRTLMATLSFAIGAIVGWPFALALAIPFVIEELFVYGADRVPTGTQLSWFIGRWKRLISAGSVSLLVLLPLVALDSLAYGKFTLVAWNIVKYNIFGGSDRGPELYGTEPWNFYFLNLFLNFNVLVPLALLSIPALGVTYLIDRKRLGFYTPRPDESSPFTILALRLLPLYLWIGILTLQPHKEERFMFPAYPLLCFNAAVSLYLVRGWQEVAFIYATKSPYRASQSSLFRTFTLSVIVGTSLISISRIFAEWHYYHSPMGIFFGFESSELPRILNETGLLPVYPPTMHIDDRPRIDLTPIKNFNVTLCLGKEWHRFGSHYLVHDGVRVEFIKSEFDGLLPGQFRPSSAPKSFAEWPWPGTWHVPNDTNDLNIEELSHYIPVETCDYLVDLDFPLHPISGKHEPRFAVQSDIWERVSCQPFLDARHSRLLTRAFWIPGGAWQSWNEFGDYCLLKNKASMAQKEERIRQKNRS